MKRLEELSFDEYKTLESTGMIAEFYPEYTGDWWKDTGRHQWKKWSDVPLHLRKYVEKNPNKSSESFPRYTKEGNNEHIMTWGEYKMSLDMYNKFSEDLDEGYASTQDQMLTELEEIYNKLGEFIKRWK